MVRSIHITKFSHSGSWENLHPRTLISNTMILDWWTASKTIIVVHEPWSSRHASSAETLSQRFYPGLWIRSPENSAAVDLSSFASLSVTTHASSSVASLSLVPTLRRPRWIEAPPPQSRDQFLSGPWCSIRGQRGIRVSPSTSTGLRNPSQALSDGRQTLSGVVIHSSSLDEAHFPQQIDGT